jgi:arylsulfatase A-like enzyme
MQRREQAIDTMLAWLALALAYRLTLHRALAGSFVWHDAWQDLLLALTMTAFAAVLAILAPRIALLTSLVLLLLAGLDAAIFSHLMAAMRIGFDRQALRDALQSDDWQLLQTASLGDWVAVLLPPVLLLGLRSLPFGRVRVRPALALACVLLLALGWTWSGPRPEDWPEDAAQNPLTVLAFAQPHTAEDDTPDELAMTVTPVCAEPTGLPEAPTQAIALPVPQTQPYNVVWFIMESTGTRYFAGAFHDNPPPMPTLRRLAQEGWYLARHQSPSNSSATSIFAMLSGLYPNPQPQMFATQGDNYVPALPQFLPPHYDKFLYTPGRLNFFFPQAFLRHSGLPDLVGFDETTVTKNVGIEHMSKDEIATITTFLARMHTAHEPFLAVYYSFSPHWPYTDYGAKWRRYPGEQPIDHYHNALWLLDNQIARIIEQLRADGQLEHTVLVLAGDHGEAFGQHAHNWAHARGSYQENFETPAVLWQPKLFQPRQITTPTSHIDLLPTLLDALGLPFDRAQLQGRSLWQPQTPRDLFAWSNEGLATVTTPEGVKLSWSPQDNHCRVYLLATDPQERHVLPCKQHPELLKTLQKWRDAQREYLLRRSQAHRQ